MLASIKASIIKQLDTLEQRYVALASQSKHDDLSDIKDDALQEQGTLVQAAIRRVGGENSVYMTEINAIMSKGGYPGLRTVKLQGVLRALRFDVDSGHLDSLAELLHGEVFGDLLEMAAHLINEGYKDAGAVIAGSSLEAHLRQLCNKHGLVTTKADGLAKKASMLNDELTAGNAYHKNDQKNVTAWLGLRNDAAHGDYSKYTKEQAALLVQSIRDFITRVPA